MANCQHGLTRRAQRQELSDKRFQGFGFRGFTCIDFFVYFYAGLDYMYTLTSTDYTLVAYRPRLFQSPFFSVLY